MSNTTNHIPFTHTRRYTYVVLCGSFLSVVLVGALYIWMSNTVRDMFTQIGDTSTDLVTLVNANAHAKTVRALVRDTTNTRDELTSYFVTDDTLVAILEDMKALGRSVGVDTTVSSVRPGKTLGKDDVLDTLTLTLDTTGTFANSVHFLALLEQYPKVAYLSSARITQNDEGEWSGLFTIVLTRVITAQI